jgi:carbonic anhydrase
VSVADELIGYARNYAKQFAKGDLPLLPRRKVAIVACMDARLLPARLFGLEEGDAHVIRNAGGVVTDDEIRSLAISQRLLQTEEIILVHHTDCGMLTFSNRDLRQKVQEDLGQDTGEFDFLPFKHLDDSVREDIEFLQATQLLDPETLIRGFVYDVKTGKLREVKVEAETQA